MKRQTVKEVASISGVTVRTLHFYDEIDLLKPAYYGKNGYRYYEKEQLQSLQQIMFYRELNVPLEQIQLILSQPDFDRLDALKSHRSKLAVELKRYRTLIRTIDDAIAELDGTEQMTSKTMFEGFSPERQQQHEKELVDRYGEGVQPRIEESKRRIKDWTKADHEASSQRWNDFLAALGALADSGKEADSTEVQALMPSHRQWLESYWTPARDSYIGLGRLYAEHADFRRQFDAVSPGLADFCASAMKTYAECELS